MYYEYIYITEKRQLSSGSGRASLSHLSKAAVIGANCQARQFDLRLLGKLYDSP